MCVHRPGKLLKFDIGPGGIQLHDGQPTGADLKFVGGANQRRGRADVCSKVVYDLNIKTASEAVWRLTLWHCVTVKGAWGPAVAHIRPSCQIIKS